MVDSERNCSPPPRMEEALASLEIIQTQLLQRISNLEHSHLPQQTTPSSIIDNTDTDTITRLSSILRTNSVDDFSFKRVPSDYYDSPLEARRDALGAASIHHLCKSIVLVNTQAPSNVIDCSDRKNSKYYVVVVQKKMCPSNSLAVKNLNLVDHIGPVLHDYSKEGDIPVLYTARFNAEAVRNFLYSLNNGTIAKKKFNLRLAPEETSTELTGFGHNAVTCIGMKTDIPVILDEAIVKLTPDFFWLGGGEVDLKLGIRTSQLIRFINPFIVSCSSN